MGGPSFERAETKQEFLAKLFIVQSYFDAILNLSRNLFQLIPISQTVLNRENKLLKKMRVQFHLLSVLLAYY